MLIGLTGRKDSGKSTVAQYLCRAHGFAEAAFADPLKQGLAALLGISRSQLEEAKARGEIEPLSGRSYRYLLQTLGTEWGRQTVNPDFWLGLAARRIAQARHQGDNVVISDVRFDNEAAMIHDLGGAIIRVIRSHPGERDCHASEAGISPVLVNYSLYNGSDLVCLEAIAEQALGLFGIVA